MPTEPYDGDRVSNFLRLSDKIVQEAQHLIVTIPNVEIFAVERSLRLLNTVNQVLQQISDQWISPVEVEFLSGVVQGLIHPLQHFLEVTDPNERPQAQTAPPGPGRGRPRVIIDIQRAIHLHDLGNSWESVAEAIGVARKTLYLHLARAGISSARPTHTEITDEGLDEVVAGISLLHPQNGAGIIHGALKSLEILVPIKRVKESLRRVDPIGIMLRWHGAIKRRVYRVRGSNALWHMDGNEKLKPWGFYIHGCVDGHSRLLIYLQCRDNKRALTVEKIFMRGVSQYGWPSRVRGDYGTENNAIEVRMVLKWGEHHKAYIRGRSVHNVRIERTWRDVRTGVIEFWRTIFLHLEEIGMLDMDNAAHRVCLFIVFQPRIQRWLDRFIQFWNHHSIRTAKNKSPLAIYELSKERAINLGFWNNDPGDGVEEIDPFYGFDGQEQQPTPEELLQEDEQRQNERDRDDGPALAEARKVLSNLPVHMDDGNNGINWYCQALFTLETYLNALA